MEAMFFVLIAAVVLAHSCYLLYANEGKTVGLLAGVVAIVLASLVALSPVAMLTQTTMPAFTTLVLAWTVYAAMVAGTGLYGYEGRSLGFYSGFLAVVSLVLGLYLLIGDFTNAAAISYYAGASALVLAVVAAFLFLHLAVRLARLKVVTGWVNLVGGIVVGLIGLLTLVGVIDLPA